MLQHSDAIEDAKKWDTAMPGVGAQRVIAITQLYFRLCNFPPIAIVVTDALCMVFGAAGASKSDLADYLGLSEERVQAGLDMIPLDMRCTSLNLNGERTGENASESNARKANKEDIRYFLNYKRILPFVYAHVSQMLLGLCSTPVPCNIATPGIERVSDDTVLASASQIFSREGGKTSFNLSYGMKRGEATEGIFCPVCRTYYCLEEFVRSASRCMGCKTDLLRVLVESIRDRLNAQYRRDGFIVSPPWLATKQRPQRLGLAEPSPPTPDSPWKKSSPDVPSVDVDPIPEIRSCPLATDPFLVQQALAFLYLYSTPFACINDDRYVVDAEDIMTEPEYEKRLQGKATLADQFHAVHRNPNTIRVKVVSQQEVEALMRKENEKKIAKRRHLPPWLTSQYQFPGGSLAETSQVEVSAPLDDESSINLTVLEDKPTRRTPHSQAVARLPFEDKEVSRKRVRLALANSSETRESLVLDAHFVAEEFFYDEFIPVKLPCQSVSQF